MVGVSIFPIILSQPTFGQKSARAAIEDKSVTTTKAQVVALEHLELTTKDIAQNRDLSLYADGGYFDCRAWTSEEYPRGVCDEDKARDFLWSKWNHKQRGYVRITYNSVDAHSTSHIFVEPDENGVWGVAWRIARWHAIPALNNKVDDINGLAAVERVEGKPSKGRWAIVFKNKDGEVIQRIPYF